MKYIAFLFIITFTFACQQKSDLIYDDDLKSAIEARLIKQKELAKNRSDKLFGVLESDITKQEKQLLGFLYAYMPLSDMADYSSEFFLEQVRYSLKARKAFKWGSKIPNDIFLHFVVPYRVNNENPDSARKVFYHELKPRIQHLTMHEAALEINHWCHEKVTYHPSDIRTSAPLSTVKNALGRCGEESTFTVTAMRAVGIPARQIYTPRWAHSDDNHAWVEVWVDGKWYFLGACEPEPELNMGWFAEPATRAMLLHSKVIGKYKTSDDIVTLNERYTEINVLPGYAPAKRVFVKVLDADSNRVKNAQVQFQLYNYAEFYPIAKAMTDESGLCSLLTGYGDLIAWASKNGLIDNKLLRVSETDTLTLVLGSNSKSGTVENYELVPPPKGKIVNVSEQEKEENNLRLQREDSIRHRYESTFIDSLSAVKKAQELNLDLQKTWSILKKSRGNWREIVSFLEQAPAGQKQLALDMLHLVSEKDLHDTDAAIFLSHLLNSESVFCNNREVFLQYVLNPHISNEILSDYKPAIQSYFGKGFIKELPTGIDKLIKWVKDSIILTDANTSRAPIRPCGVLELKYAGNHSRDIFFVAACRSLGIPARLEESRSIPQVYLQNKWTDISFKKLISANKPKGTITLNYQKGLASVNPEYYIHFTVARFNGSSYQSLDYEFSSAFKTFPARIVVDTGKYALVTGKRYDDGSVMAKVKYFDVSENENVSQSIVFNQKSEKNTIYGKVDLKKEINCFDARGGQHQVGLDYLAHGKGLVMIWIDPDKEPTKHLMNDLSKLGPNFSTWAGSFVFFIPKAKYSDEFEITHYKNLPANTYYLIDNEGLLSVVGPGTGTGQGQDYPKVYITNSNGEIIYISSGYKIGNGEQILNAVNTRCTYK